MPIFSIPLILNLLKAVGPITARLPEFVEVFNQIKGTFHEKDQAVLQDAYRNLMDENTGGHARLQEQLRKAALEG